MLIKEKIERINELAHKKKIAILTDEEQDEQLALRAEYLDAFRKSFRKQLDSIEIVDEPQSNNKKNEGEKAIEKSTANVGYNAAEELEKKTVSGEVFENDGSYKNAELLEQRNEEKIHEFMANDGKED